MLLHTRTKEAIDGFIAKPGHSLILVAPLGSGKSYVAKYIASQLLGVDAENYAYFYHIQPLNGVITIDTIRELKNFLQLKTAGKNSIRRVVLIEDATLMNQEAQNSLLKILEEPPADSAIILTASNPNNLLPTIVSRAQQLRLHKVTHSELVDYFSKNSSNAEVEKAYHMSDGRVGLMYALLQKTEKSHPLAENIELAKELYKKPIYERLLSLNDLLKTDLDMLSQGLYSVAHVALVAAAERGNQASVSKWYSTCKVIHKIQSDLKYKPQSKLVLTDLLINL